MRAPSEPRHRIGRNFVREHKSAAAYLDLAANSHGAEKGFLVRRALDRVRTGRPQVVEVGPGGGAAVSFLATQLEQDPDEGRTVHLTLIEAPGVVSQSLTGSVTRSKPTAANGPS